MIQLNPLSGGFLFVYMYVFVVVVVVVVVWGVGEYKKSPSSNAMTFGPWALHVPYTCKS